jgi:hypothetical protein
MIGFKRSYLFFIIFILINIFSNLSWALDLDEKLTCRFLKLSNSKKTALINRGAEDGLVVGDHAKFYITSGIIARGMVEKVSPSRSIWSIYRIVSSDDLVDGKVANLKISTPLKVTNDPTKSLKEEDVIEGMEKEKPNKEDNENPKVSATDTSIEDDAKEIESMEGAKATKKGNTSKLDILVEPKTEHVAKEEVDNTWTKSNKNYTWEGYGTISLNAISGTTSGNAITSTSSLTSTYDISLGIEKYFFNSSFMKEYSIFGFIYKRSMEEGDNYKTISDWFQYGAGLNYHFFNPPNKVNKLIVYFTGSFGVGSTTVEENVITGGSSTLNPPTKGTNSFFNLGIGSKYYVGNLGARVTLEYNFLSESFSYQDGTSKTRSLNGPRLLFGMSYRFL